METSWRPICYLREGSRCALTLTVWSMPIPRVTTKIMFKNGEEKYLKKSWRWSSQSKEMKDPRLKGPLEFQRQEVKKNFSLDHTIVKIKTTKEKILIASREEWKVSVKDENQTDIGFFNSQCWSNIFKVMKKLGKIFYSAKLSFKYEVMIKICP